MAGYRDTKKLIEDTLVGRPAGTMIYPEGHQNFALSLLDYIRSVELLGSSALQGIATPDTVPVQPNTARVSYVGCVAPGETVVFNNFYDENGDRIEVVSPDGQASFCIFLWNCEYWSIEILQVQITSVQVVDNLEDGGSDSALSARMGVLLNQKITTLVDMVIALGNSVDAIFKKAAYKSPDVEGNIIEFENILSLNLIGISATYVNSGVFYDKQGLEGLRQYLTVTAYYLDGTQAEVSIYSLSGTLEEGVCTITVSYLSETTTFDVLVEEVEYYRKSDSIAYKIALRSAFTSGNKNYAATINGVMYYYTQTPNASASINYRSCYYLFDLLWTAGSQYELEFYYHGMPSGYNVLFGLQAFNQSFYADGSVNSATPKDHGSDVTDSGWLTPDDNGSRLKIAAYTAPAGTIGTRIVLKAQDNGVDAVWPTSFVIDYFIVRLVQ